jgi:predicted kinase
MVKSLFEAGHETVIIDATHTSVLRRDRWKDIINEDTKIVYKVFRTDRDVCKQRALDTNKPYLVDVIDNMLSKWDDLTDEEQVNEML